MQTLIERLLFLARSDDRNLKINREPIDLHLLVEEVLQDIRLLAPDRDFELAGTAELIIQGDRDMLRQMLLIFLDNSMKYSNPGSPIHIDQSVGEKTVRIAICDFGPGIDPENRDAIFDRFYRIDDSRSKKSGGFGLGLSIAKKIIEFHSGTVSVHSTPGEGSTFTIILPSSSYRFFSKSKPVKSNITDNESAKMVSSHGVIQGYNGIATVDEKHQVVVDGHEAQRVESVVEPVAETAKALDPQKDLFDETVVTADSGFHSETSVKAVLDAEIDAYIADNQLRRSADAQEEDN